ncbi:MAG: helix-turn-helix domain-containing protein [Spirochaetales bacterium]|nr:helix-turn-helix domain-containing protein [Spirochaetales bacterium]
MNILDVVFVYQMKEEAELRWHGRFHHHGKNEYEAHYFLQGSGSFLNSGKTYTISPGVLFITNPGENHSILLGNRENPLTYYAVLFSVEKEDEEVYSLLQHDMTADRIYQIGSNYRFFFEELKERGMSRDKLLNRAASHQFVSFLYLMAARNYSFHYGDETNQHIEKALRIMQSNIFNDLQLQDIALKLDLNESYFIRLFRTRMKTTPKKYYTRLKIEAAASMLISTELAVYEIADRLLFYSEFHFSRVFKQYTGKAPTVYRETYRQHLGGTS